jgi:hypothetical protein
MDAAKRARMTTDRLLTEVASILRQRAARAREASSLISPGRLAVSPLGGLAASVAGNAITRGTTRQARPCWPAPPASSYPPDRAQTPRRVPISPGCSAVTRTRR